MKTSAVRVALLLLIVEPAFAQAPGNAQLVDMATRMARIGRASSPTFSPDGKRLAFVSDLNGVPQVWMAPVDGGAPTQITKSDDPVGRVIWSPKGDRLVFSLAPGGGMNTQIYVVHHRRPCVALAHPRLANAMSDTLNPPRSTPSVMGPSVSNYPCRTDVRPV